MTSCEQAVGDSGERKKSFSTGRKLQQNQDEGGAVICSVLIAVCNK